MSIKSDECPRVRCAAFENRIARTNLSGATNVTLMFKHDTIRIDQQVRRNFQSFPEFGIPLIGAEFICGEKTFGALLVTSCNNFSWYWL
jgi:hypothetical protein